MWRDTNKHEWERVSLCIEGGILLLLMSCAHALFSYVDFQDKQLSDVVTEASATLKLLYYKSAVIKAKCNLKYVQ